MKRLAILLWAVSVLGATGAARADEIYQFVIQKQEQKKVSRWSLSEWLDTRDRMRLMDLWLALHSPVPYEFYVGADFRPLDEPSGTSDSRLSFAAFASIFGLGVERESDPGRLNLAFLLRVFGFHEQGTHITLQAGLRNQSDPVSFRSFYAGGELGLAINRFFGLQGGYRHLYSATPNAAGRGFSGNQWETNLHIDFSFFRVYGGVFHQTEDGEHRRGPHFGARFFF